MLPALRTGEAIIVGEAVHLPLRAVIDTPTKNRRPDSHDPKVESEAGIAAFGSEPRGRRSVSGPLVWLSPAPRRCGRSALVGSTPRAARGALTPNGLQTWRRAERESRTQGADRGLRHPPMGRLPRPGDSAGRAGHRQG